LTVEELPFVEAVVSLKSAGSVIKKLAFGVEEMLSFCPFL